MSPLLLFAGLVAGFGWGAAFVSAAMDVAEYRAAMFHKKHEVRRLIVAQLAAGAICAAIAVVLIMMGAG